MAFLLPQNIPSRNDISDRMNLLGRSLRDALADADDVTVWLEGRGAEAHLLVLDPACGILLLEAPRPGASAGSEEGRPGADGIREAVRRRMSEVEDASRSLRVDGLPAACAIALPDLEPPAAGRSGRAAAGERTLFREDFRPDRLRAAFRRVLGGRTRALEPEEVRLARAAVNPRIIIDRPGAVQGRLALRPVELSSEEILRMLDREQERAAEYLGWGYQVLRGVAGSGKTLVLLHRARHLARLYPGWRILVLCFNKALSLEMDRQMGGIDQIKVSTLDSLAYRYAYQNARRRRGEDRFELWRETACKRVRTLGDGKRFDAVLVDEAQDLGKSGLDLAWEMLKRGRRMLKPGRQDPGAFIMAMDPDQDIFLQRRREMDWNPPGMTARGRTTIFRRNYRNTREVVGLAWELLSELSPQRRDTVEPEAAREGPPPEIVECGGLAEEARVIADRVKGLLEGGVEPDSILVMFGPGNEQIARLCEPFERSGVPYHFVQRDRESRDAVVSVRGKVLASNLRGLKGLEFGRVFIGGANHVWMPGEQDNPESIGRLLYVGMTRAMDELTITYSGEGPIGAALQSIAR